MPSILFPRVDCDANPNDVACEKPSSGDKRTPIVIGTVIGTALIALMVVLYLLHMRRKRNDQKEWPKDPQELEDYGFDSPGGIKAPKSAKQRDNRMSNLPTAQPQVNPFGNQAEVVSGGR
ncbi:hypothetical protein PG984_013377 [Apiospora sp. TS-2023a]|uniref:Uncharacterized protein n=1 Tax=Apiospora saccharicola TaxID=335842 RepID=A0ABR1UXC8_9PEZI